jgi:hypothetical protein
MVLIWIRYFGILNINFKSSIFIHIQSPFYL